MHIDESRHDSVVIVAPVGRIDSTTAGALEGRLIALLAQGTARVVVDYAGVEYISSAGLRVMLMLVKKLRETRGSLVLCGLNEPVRQVFDLAGFLPLFAIEPSREAALARLT